MGDSSPVTLNILTPFYRHGLADRLVESVMAFDYPFRWLIAVDGRRPDAVAYQFPNDKRITRVVVDGIPEGTGAAKQLNTLIQIAQDNYFYEYAWRLDDDNAIHPNFSAWLRGLDLDCSKIHTGWQDRRSRILKTNKVAFGGIDAASAVMPVAALMTYPEDAKPGTPGDYITFSQIYESGYYEWVHHSEIMCYYNRLR